MNPRPLLHRLLLSACLLFAFSAVAVEHTFELDPTGWHEVPQSVAVAGTFNGWSMTTHPMERNGDGLYTATVDLDPGIYLYKFVVNGSNWINDKVHSDPELEEPDGHGGMNSAVLIGEDARKLPAPEPNHIRVEALSHNPDDFTHLSVVNENLVLFGLTTQADDVEEVLVYFWQGTEVTYPLQHEKTELGRDFWVGLVPVSRHKNQHINYHFLISDGDAEAVLAPDMDSEEASYFTVSLTPTFTTPDWAKHATWYQIFPERFRNGDPSNDPGEAEFETLLPWTSDWWKVRTDVGEVRGDDNFYTGHGNVWRRRYGGDIQGVREALPYLRKLGVNAIYFNPIFEADSMHKYDTADFRHVDDNLGVKAKKRFDQVAGETDDPATWGWSESDKVFLDFLQEAKAMGFKVVIDGVFNHVGTSHPFFQDVLKNGKESRYVHWFEITDWDNDQFRNAWNPHGIGYVAWDGPNGALPVFKNDHETGLGDGPRQHIFAITERWLDPNGDGDPSDGVDGWRLDVPGDIAHPFWIEWRELVKGINPDAYITGEIWPWAHPWLKGDQFDAVMNYQFAMPAVDFFVDKQLTPSEFAQRLNRVAYSYPMQVSLAQMNLFDSHDTDRLASMFVNPGRSYDGQNRLQDTGPNYDPRQPNKVEKQRMKLAMVCQFTFVGAPMIYYGTEAGMWSPDDPSNRQPMTWPDLEPYDNPQVTFDQGMFDDVRHLMAMRHTYEALRLGAFHPVYTDDARGVLAYERVLGDERIYVVLNNSDRSRKVSLPLAEGQYVDVLTPGNTEIVEPERPEDRLTLAIKEGAEVLVAGEDQALTLSLGKYRAAVLVPVTKP
ncbi:alpha-amylase family glycosyl hydrolase [Algisphaera agarilytica]|uniref:Glycosidase n=1 Tax=Algisphaera agarilytica TaxID=1385975 RepID=A0A7X0LK20_9BACT|nr:alpha-amylase family glycosyl hydrolase [Algisphaera agarilytica]MBB6429181.1 glycosidase [Algisphaera agarilytica]